MKNQDGLIVKNGDVVKSFSGSEPKRDVGYGGTTIEKVTFHINKSDMPMFFQNDKLVFITLEMPIFIRTNVKIRVDGDRLYVDGYLSPELSNSIKLFYTTYVESLPDSLEIRQ
jgi:hypothetical protein